MPSSNILLFDANKANMMSDEQYNTNTQRLNGVQSGIASSQLQNKTLYQVSLVAYAIAQIMNQNGLDANDTAAVSAFVSNLSSTMLQKVADLASDSDALSGTSDAKWMSAKKVFYALQNFAVMKSGGTMSGPLILSGSPTQNLQAVTKQYVDNVAPSFTSAGTKSGSLTNTGNASTTNVTYTVNLLSSVFPCEILMQGTINRNITLKTADSVRGLVLKLLNIDLGVEYPNGSSMSFNDSVRFEKIIRLTDVSVDNGSYNVGYEGAANGYMTKGSSYFTLVVPISCGAFQNGLSYNGTNYSLTAYYRKFK